MEFKPDMDLFKNPEFDNFGTTFLIVHAFQIIV